MAAKKAFIPVNLAHNEPLPGIPAPDVPGRPISLPVARGSGGSGSDIPGIAGNTEFRYRLPRARIAHLAAGDTRLPGGGNSGNGNRIAGTAESGELRCQWANINRLGGQNVAGFAYRLLGAGYFGTNGWLVKNLWCKI